MSEKGFFNRLADAWNAFQVDSAAEKPIAGEVAYADPFRLMPMSQFTPYNPDELITRKGFSTLDKMRDDDQIKACMTFKKLAACAAGWQILSPDTQEDDWEVTRFVQSQLDCLPGTFQHALFEILSAMDYGFSVSEKIWTPIESGEFAGKIGYAAIKTRKPHFFGFKQDEYGNITALEQYSVAGGYGPPDRTLPIRKFVIYSYMEEFDNPYGNSDLRSAYRYWWNKDHAMKWLMMMLEKYGIPPLFGLYDPAEITGTELDQLKTIFNRMQAATNVLIPALNGPGPDNRAFDLEFPEVSGQVASVFDPALDRFDIGIARALLMPGLLGLSPDQVSGSLARSKTSFDMFLLVQQYLRSEIEEFVNEQIIRELVDYNFNVDEYPIFALNEIDDDVRTDLLKTWAELLRVGAVIGQDEDENHIRSMMGFPDRKEDDAESDDDDDGGMDDDYGPMPDVEFNSFRKVNTYEAKCDLHRISTFMDSSEQKYIRKAGAVFESAKADISNRIRRKGVNIDTLKSINEMPGKAKLRKIYQDMMNDNLSRGRRDLRRELRAPSMHADEGPNYTPPEATRYLREKAINLASTASDAVINAVRQALQKSIELGETTQAATVRLDAVFRPFMGVPGVKVDGEQLEPYRLENIVRTESTAAYNQGRLIEARGKDIVSRMRGMEYSAILDSRTTPVCESLDGKIFEIGDPNLDRLKPPNHFQCRSILVPITTYEEIDGRDIISPSESGRAIELAGKGFV